MTVNTTNITSGPYAGNDVADTFSYTFRVTDKSQISVYETDDNGVRTLLTVDTDYTVAGIGDDDGGTITRVAGALPTNYEWFIRSNYQETQLTAFESQGAFFPDLHEDMADKLTFLIQQLRDEVDRSFRLSKTIGNDGTFTIAQDAATRAGLSLGFDDSGNLVVKQSFDAVSVVQEDLDKRHDVTISTVAVMKSSTPVDIAGNPVTLNAGVIVRTQGYTTAGDGGGGIYLVAGNQVVDGFSDHLLDNNNVVLLQGDFPHAKQFGVTFDGTTDDTASWQAMATKGGVFDCRSVGTTIIDSVSLTKNLQLHCIKETRFKRKDGADGASESYWNAGAAMFEVDADGLSFSVLGAFEYDGNNTNQTTTEPTGWFVKTYPQASPTGADTQIYLQKGEFFNGTSGYLLLRGDDVNQRYETLVGVDDCIFHETVYGKGKGDPSTPTALGYAPTMVLVLDYVRLYTKNFTADWEKVTGTGQYAACAINGTFFGVDYNLSGESHVYLHGTTRITGLGRSAKKWDDDNDWVTNNGIGAIDMYGNAHTLYVENVVAVDCENVPVRAKASLKNYIVMAATLTNCHRGLQVGPSSTGDPETVCYVGTVTCEGGTVPQLEFVGNLSTATIRSVHIDHASSYGTKTNPENLANEAVFRFRNCSKVTTSSLFVEGAPLRGVYALDCIRFMVDSILVNSAGAEGILVQGADTVKLDAVDIRNTLGAAVSFAGTIHSAVVNGGFVDNAAGYGIFGNFTGRMDIAGVKIENLTGVDRATYFAANARGSVVGCESSSANPIFSAAGALYSARDNSWEPVEFWGTAAPISGTYRVGDRVWDSTPAAAGKMGWVCTTAGTPGTWKPFGAIDA